MVKILIVEDEAATAMYLANLITDWGYEVIGPCADAKEALELAERDLPYMALMDIQLAGEQDGVEAAGELWKRHGIGVIYLSANSSENILERAKTTGAYGYLLKPYSERTLRMSLELAVAKIALNHRIDDVNMRLTEVLDLEETLDAKLQKWANAIAESLQIALVQLWILRPGSSTLTLEATAGSSPQPEGVPRNLQLGEGDIGKVALTVSHLSESPVSNTQLPVVQQWIKSERIVAFEGYPLIAAPGIVGVMAVYSLKTLPKEMSRALEQSSKLFALEIAGNAALMSSQTKLQNMESFFTSFGITGNAALPSSRAAEKLEIGKSSSKVQSVLESISVSVVVIGQDGFVKMINRAAETLFLNRLRVGDYAGEMLLSGNAVSEIEVPLENGSTHIVQAREAKTNWFGEEARILTFEDVTERQTLVKKIEESRQTAIEALRIKSEFLATMSHELRTPMNGVLGFAELLDTTALTPEQRQFVEIIQHSGTNLTAIIDDLLDISNIEAGCMKLEEGEFQIGSLVKDVIERGRQMLGDKPVRLCSELSNELPTRLWGDARRIRQILMNLVGNGVKFTAEGSVSAKAQLLSIEHGRARIRIEVSDTGPGIPKEKHALLFAPFQQLDSSSTRSYGGLGLGLAISYQLVAMMKGKIGVESDVGRGATFWLELTLPVARPEEGNFGVTGTTGTEPRS